MSYKNFLTHVADIERRIEIVDRFGQQSEAWQVVCKDVPCRLNPAQTSRNVEITSLGVREAIQGENVVFFMPNVDITEEDRITNIRHRDGSTVTNIGDLRVYLVNHIYGMDGKVHHIEAQCTAVKENVAS